MTMLFIVTVPALIITGPVVVAMVVVEAGGLPKLQPYPPESVTETAFPNVGDSLKLPAASWMTSVAAAAE